MARILRYFVGFALILQISAFSHKSIYPKPLEVNSYAEDADDGPGEMLLLTPLIQSGKIEEARDLALVRNLTDVISYSGFLTVNPKYNANMYFWFFPAAFNPEKAPLTIWLQGGPGGSSLFGLFVENGPFIIDADNNIQFRNTAWTLTHSVIYFDNPVGTGFSFTDDGGYAKTEEDVARDLYEAIQQFFQLFPEYQLRDFYITGESYAGKYVPAISYKIHTENQKTAASKRINFKGMAIGDGFSDPENMLNYGEYLYNIGLLDQNQRTFFANEEEKARQFIRQSKWRDAFETIDRLMDGDLTKGGSYFQNITGLNFYFNFLIASDPPEQNYFSGFLQQNYVRRAIHVGNASYADMGSKVETNLREDMYKSVKPWIEALLDAEESYKILLYSGQLDIIVANTLTDNMVRKFNWKGAQEFANATRKIWRVGNTDVAGYVKTARNFTQLLFRNAGHMVPTDQPKWAFDMINRFTSGKPFA